MGGADRVVVACGTSYWFTARDEAAAESMADALAAFGFGEVAAYPTRRRHFLERGMGWELAAFDGNRYPPGNLGLQQELAVERQARAIARAHGGFATGGSVSGAGGASLRNREPGPPPLLRRNPASRPRIPPVPEVTAPPRGDLALAPDPQRLRPLRLDVPEVVSWSDFDDGTGPDPVPAELTGWRAPAMTRTGVSGSWNSWPPSCPAARAGQIPGQPSPSWPDGSSATRSPPPGAAASTGR